MTPTNRPSHREAMRDAAAEKPWGFEGTSLRESGFFKRGADWQFNQDKARIEKAIEHLKRLTKIEFPPHPVGGVEFASYALTANCEYAKEALKDLGVEVGHE